MNTDDGVSPSSSERIPAENERERETQAHVEARPLTVPGQSSGQNDAVASALAEALRAATLAGEWTTVAELAKQIGALAVRDAKPAEPSSRPQLRRVK